MPGSHDTYAGLGQIFGGVVAGSHFIHEIGLHGVPIAGFYHFLFLAKVIQYIGGMWTGLLNSRISTFMLG